MWKLLKQVDYCNDMKRELFYKNTILHCWIKLQNVRWRKTNISMNFQLAGTLTEEIMQFVSASNPEHSPNYVGPNISKIKREKLKKKRVWKRKNYQWKLIIYHIIRIQQIILTDIQMDFQNAYYFEQFKKLNEKFEHNNLSLNITRILLATCGFV